MNQKTDAAIDPQSVVAKLGSGYPAPFNEPCMARSKRALGDAFGLDDYGVNLVTLEPGAWSAQRHWHTREDEFVYIVAGEATLVTDAGRMPVKAGMCAGFKAGTQDGHHLVNESGAPVTYLEIGSRKADDDCHYPDIDLQILNSGRGGTFTRKDGSPYEEG